MVVEAKSQHFELLDYSPIAEPGESTHVNPITKGIFHQKKVESFLPLDLGLQKFLDYVAGNFQGFGDGSVLGNESGHFRGSDEVNSFRQIINYED